MTNEEFQTIVLKKFDTMEGRFDTLESDLTSVKTKLDAVADQVAVLTEFKTDTEQYFTDTKETLNFILHKELLNEKEVFLLRKKQAQ
ncbi:hypothetical protein [Acetobacterium sp. K1/6]|jgi:3-dehydroquinate dehydratase|uniref:hypothetical protein n=2 Tax=unclassified Acetobacterium TaxID=2638182 RepID=UPI000DBEB357|nr:hypothetical protein [Acetobacterium sp. K1/6]AWW26880.1 hypothetical protein DOZ58_09720 [Acetobacterium sp. KB-1]MDZ5725109.1 hypothetical protein [Acetobacterium sp. K1/6]